MILVQGPDEVVAGDRPVQELEALRRLRRLGGRGADVRGLAAQAESVFDLSEQPKQIAAQLATVVIGKPGRARPIERLSDGILGRNRLQRPVTAICYAMIRGDTVGRATH